MTDLRFPDAEALADLGTLVARAKSVDPEGAIRLQAHGRTLAAYVGVLPGTGLLAEGAVIGLRTMPLAEDSDVDVTVPLAAVSDRLARRDTDPGQPALAVPPVGVRAPWAAVAPPRGGWERVGSLAADVVNEAAREGIEEVAQGTPQQAGGHAVAALRQRVWQRSTTTVPPFPAGGAFAAYVLGFTPPGAEVTVFAHGRWTRLSTPRGHVLVR
ncbi:hypothetical protein P0Y31_11115 [Knoellia sp. 3-2P3]|uniref:hypothetical protein n=1 Tax=unclassified Knoellia TaxID=2618719 RepID=UPI0023DC0917|nr:hypothetical protein [Knoellia sp. 3-2P3]MDF2092895.1 hypothetical protein [Knoellia sp. 3-2P3]